MAGRLALDQEYSLPTEAEWEYACRAGTQTMYSFGDNPKDLGKYAWFGRINLNGKHAHMVAAKPPNAWGLFDMHGKVSEWCLDTSAGMHMGGADPVVADADADSRVMRGGSWKSGYCHSAYRDANSLEQASSFTGLRPVIVPCRNISWTPDQLSRKDVFDRIRW